MRAHLFEDNIINSRVVVTMIATIEYLGKRKGGLTREITRSRGLYTRVRPTYNFNTLLIPRIQL